MTPERSPAVSRDSNKLDLFVAGNNGIAYTAAWDAGRPGRLAGPVGHPRRMGPRGRDGRICDGGHAA